MTFAEGPLGLKIKTDSTKGTIVAGASEGSQAAAQSSPSILKGDAVIAIGDDDSDTYHVAFSGTHRIIAIL